MLLRVDGSLICNDAWYDAADSVVKCVGVKCSAHVVRAVPSNRAQIIFIEQLNVERWWLTPANRPTNRYVLVSSNNVDDCTPTGSATTIDALLADANLLAWFGTNLVRTHRKMRPLPLGPKVQWQSHAFHGEERSKNTLIRLLEHNDPAGNFRVFNRPLLIDMSMSPGSADNKRCKALAADQSRRAALAHFSILRTARVTAAACMKHQMYDIEQFVYRNDSEHTTQAEYFNKLRCTRFVAAPEGNGLDTHRLYEALYMGAIPIVIDFAPLRPLYRDLPVLAVERWSNITLEQMAEKYRVLHEPSRHYNWSRLTAEPWLSEIFAAAAEQ